MWGRGVSFVGMIMFKCARRYCRRRRKIEGNMGCIRLVGIYWMCLKMLIRRYRQSKVWKVDCSICSIYHYDSIHHFSIIIQFLSIYIYIHYNCNII